MLNTLPMKLAEQKNYGVFEAITTYTLVLEPGRELIDKIKTEASQVLHSGEQDHQIILGKFFAREEMEETMIRWIQKICNLQGSFEIQLNNFGGRPPHSIFLKVQDPSPLNKIISQLKMVDQFIQASGFPPSQLFYSPQLLLTEKIPEHSFYEMLEEYAAKSFHESFTAENMKLFKTSDIPGRSKLVSSFSLPSSARYQ
jgi:hypothetical protein